MYSNPVTRLHPTAFIVLIDRSGSMKEKIVFAGTEMTKARAVTIVANSFIDELLHRARREGGTRNYYDIAVIGYSGDGIASLVSPHGEFTTPSRLVATNVPRQKLSRERLLPSGRSIVATTEHNMWITEQAVGITPMCGAMGSALALIEKWCRKKTNAASYPPTVINITDGEASDGDEGSVRAIAEKIRRTGTGDGGTILMNIHLAKAAGGSVSGNGAPESNARPVLFPSSVAELPDHRYARLLFDISSEMPEGYNDVVASMRPGAVPPFRAVAFNSLVGDVAAMINIGSVNSIML